MSESQEAQMARQDERIKNILDSQIGYRNDIKEMSTQLGQMFHMLSGIENRLKVLEEKSEPSEDMVKEYTELKQQVAGAKAIIRTIWVVLAGLFATGMALKTEIIKLLG
ncbi:MAG: hypothetical protein ACK5LG_21940 [Bacteroides thetaiotaomicron]